MRIWTKLLKKEKIIKDNVFVLPNNYDINRLSLYLSDICNELDVAMPILLEKHYHHLYFFKGTTFTKSDFIDECYFDKMVCEIIPDENEKVKRFIH